VHIPCLLFSATI